MKTRIAIHEVENGDNWAKAWHKGEGGRHEQFGKLGLKCRTFRDPKNPDSVAVIIEAEDFTEFENFLASDEGREAIAKDGVKMETLRFLSEFTD
ncbi:MAG: hypothetical protein M3R15_21035 [Acidobacteriota bacterium]|nr:hypothetical protein [Acidobacteriota bacterium]